MEKTRRSIKLHLNLKEASSDGMAFILEELKANFFQHFFQNDGGRDFDGLHEPCLSGGMGRRVCRRGAAPLAGVLHEYDEPERNALRSRTHKAKQVDQAKGMSTYK